MRLKNLKTGTASILIVAASCFLWPSPVLAQFGFGNPEVQPAQIPKPAPLTHHFELYYDGRTTANSTLKKDVIAPQELQQTPIYENAPFLLLKPGDKLCAGVEHFKGKARSWDATYYFVRHDGKYYELDRVSKRTKFRLWDARLSLLFDWDLSLAAAGQLRQIYGPRDEVSLAPEKYQDLKAAVRQKFPDIECEDGEITVQQPFIEGEGESRHGVFEGLAFDSDTDTIYEYKLQISPQILREERKNLIIGPPRVARWEFEGRHKNGINAAAPYTPDAQTVAIKRAAYERMVAFHRVLEPFVPSLKNADSARDFEF